MTGRKAIVMFATWVLAVLALGSPAMGQDRRAVAVASGSVDVRSKPLDWIPPGTVIGEGAPKGWTDLILLATPRIGVGDVNDVPRTAASYSSMFLFTILANVRAERAADQASYVLEKVAIGTALNINGQNVIASSENTFGADLGMIGRRVLSENEKILKGDVRQVARTSTMLVFDANAFVLRNQKHRSMVIRHVILASPTTGQISTFAWLMGSDGGSGYALADKGLQKLPAAFHEDRVLSVDAQRFTLGIPSADAFALAKIPQGTPLGFSEALKSVAATKQFTTQAASQLEAELQARYAPVAARNSVAAKVRK
jgi:hypothetical protein